MKTDEERARPWMAEDLADLRAAAVNDVLLMDMFGMMERGVDPRAAMIETLGTLSRAALAAFRQAVEREEKKAPTIILAPDPAALASARREGRREGIEEAAKVAERRWRARSEQMADCKKAGGAVEALAGKMSEAHAIATEIRALATPAQEEKPKTEIPDWFWGSLR